MFRGLRHHGPRALLVTAFVAFLPPAGGVLCLGESDHVAIEYVTTSGACCGESGSADADAPRSCRSCNDVVLTATAALCGKPSSTPAAAQVVGRLVAAPAVPVHHAPHLQARERGAPPRSVRSVVLRR